MADDTNPDIRISWILSDGTVSLPATHSLSAYEGVVPNVGDVIAVGPGNKSDAARVSERYLVQNFDSYSWWHLVVESTTLTSDRKRALFYLRDSRRGH